MKILTIDIGTSLAKLGFFVDGNLISKEKGIDHSQLNSLTLKYSPDRVIISSVTIPEKEIMALFDGSIPVMVLSHKTPVPIENEYLSKETLGTDRLAAVVGAYGLFPGKDCLVIDMGTCITYDFLSSQGVYKGGSISPGMQLKFMALNNYTSRLPLLNRVDDVDLTGNTTKNAILSGVVNGTIAEINEITRMYRNKLPDLQLVICGGDSSYYANRLHFKTELYPDLVLTGLKTIQEYNG